LEVDEIPNGRNRYGKYATVVVFLDRILPASSLSGIRAQEIKEADLAKLLGDAKQKEYNLESSVGPSGQIFCGWFSQRGCPEAEEWLRRWRAGSEFGHEGAKKFFHTFRVGSEVYNQPTPHFSPV
jgi:hypothetical protein